MTDTALRARDLTRTYQDGEREVEVLRGLSLELAMGQSVAIVGRSGTGKSTLLNLLGGLDRPTTGFVEVSGQRLHDMSEGARCRWRNQHLGFVFQFHHLMPEFSALESVAMPARIAGVGRGKAELLARALLEQLDLGDRVSHRPHALSGGERQRVAIARALVNQPKVVLMDEPTGNLDPESANSVLELMASLERFSSSFVVVTHDKAVAQQMDTCWRLANGTLVAS